jgi:ABC-type sulfate/molybdate transport systems ATPase subunit
MRLLLELSEKEGITVVMVTHDMGLAGLADRVVRIRDGKITAVSANDPASKAEARREIVLGTEEFRAGEDARDAQDPAAQQAVVREVVTERRPPEFYASYVHHMQRKAEREGTGERRREQEIEAAAMRSRARVTGTASPSLVRTEDYVPPAPIVPAEGRRDPSRPISRPASRASDGGSRGSGESRSRRSDSESS